MEKDKKMEKGETRKEKGERRKEKGERRKEKGKRRKEEGERREEKSKISPPPRGQKQLAAAVHQKNIAAAVQPTNAPSPRPTRVCLVLVAEAMVGACPCTCIVVLRPADFRGPLSSMRLPSSLPGKLHEDRAESFKAREGGRGAI